MARRVAVDLPAQPGRVQAIKQRLRRVLGGERVGRRELITNPDEVPAWKKERFGNVQVGTSQNQ
jgi:hypothetical protein